MKDTGPYYFPLQLPLNLCGVNIEKNSAGDNDISLSIVTGGELTTMAAGGSTGRLVYIIRTTSGPPLTGISSPSILGEAFLNLINIYFSGWSYVFSKFQRKKQLFQPLANGV